MQAPWTGLKAPDPEFHLKAVETEGPDLTSLYKGTHRQCHRSDRRSVRIEKSHWMQGVYSEYEVEYRVEYRVLK